MGNLKLNECCKKYVDIKNLHISYRVRTVELIDSFGRKIKIRGYKQIDKRDIVLCPTCGTQLVSNEEIAKRFEMVTS